MGKRTDELPDPAILEKRGKVSFPGSRRVADGCQVLRPLSRQGVDQVLGLPGGSEPAEHDHGPIGDVFDGLIGGRVDLVHVPPKPLRNGLDGHNSPNGRAMPSRTEKPMLTGICHQ